MKNKVVRKKNKQDKVAEQIQRGFDVAKKLMEGYK